jgi:chromosome segregation ATPase
MADRDEKVVEEVEALLDRLREDAMREIAEAKDRASANATRYDEAQRELYEAGAEITRLSAEREALPDRAYRAGMDEDYALEDDLKERYKNLRPAIEGLQKRQAELEREISSLCQRPWGHHYDAQIEQNAQAARVANDRKVRLEALEKRLKTALARAVGPVRAEHERLYHAVQGMAKSREAEHSPVGRGALMS